jgi:tetratricopeptide (TPR) repeat protein
MNTPPHRRLLIALTCMLLSALLFHDAVAVALVTRGDGYLQKGKPDQARVYYARALFFDRASRLAADRYAFSGLELRTPEALRSSIIIASTVLAHEPNDINLLEDRGLLYQIAHRYHLAHADFVRVAALSHDPRWYHLAAWAAYRALHDNKATSSQ